MDAWTFTVSVGLLALRLVFGLYMAAHGTQKLAGWFGGHGLAATAGTFDQMGFRPGRFFASLASAAEVLSGALVVLGLLGPVGPALMVAVMIVAAGGVHRPYGLFAANHGIELPFLYGAVGVTLSLTGPGLYSLDRVFGLEWLMAPTLAWGTLGAGVVGGLAGLLIRRSEPPA